MVDSRQLSAAFRSGKLAARAARIEAVDGKVLRLSDGSTLEVRAKQGWGGCGVAWACSCAPALVGHLQRQPATAAQGTVPTWPLTAALTLPPSRCRPRRSAGRHCCAGHGEELHWRYWLPPCTRRYGLLAPALSFIAPCTAPRRPFCATSFALEQRQRCPGGDRPLKLCSFLPSPTRPCPQGYRPIARSLFPTLELQERAGYVPNEDGNNYEVQWLYR